MKEILVNSSKHNEVIDITDQVKEIVEKSKTKEGTCTIFTKHATAAIIVNENCDEAVCKDIIDALNNMIPEHGKWEHDKIDNNAAAHIKASIIGPSETIPIQDSELQLGTWQGIGLVELDGPKQRKILIKISNEM